MRIWPIFSTTARLRAGSGDETARSVPVRNRRPANHDAPPCCYFLQQGGASRSGASVLEIQAEPLVDFHRLEEVFLLQRPADSITPESDAVYTRRTPVLEKPEEPAPEAGGAQ